MNAKELATKIYEHILSLNNSNEHWDKWDDKREIEYIESLIDEYNQLPKANTQKNNKLDYSIDLDYD